ncbi:MAG: hypothetical protein ACYC8T_13460 [Myxococcaceae bacterium]
MGQDDEAEWWTDLWEGGVELTIETHTAQDWPKAILGWVVQNLVSGAMEVSAGVTFEDMVARQPDWSSSPTSRHAGRWE